ncbi:MAG: DUF3795 domain-containing protein [Candidatus Bathyarchaeia archaeon]
MKEEAYNNVKDQAGPCGITCGTCVLGNGTIAETAEKTKEHITGYGIKEWAPMVPGGKDINWIETEKTMDWMSQYATCAGCEKGGGPPDCGIRSCATEKGFQLCNECSELADCNKFDWLQDYAKTLKTNLNESKGLSKKEYIEKQLAKV